MRVLITGASGFVGSHLLPLLKMGLHQHYSELACWSRAVDGDVLSHDDRSRVLEEVEPDAVIHLAWITTGTATYEVDPSSFRWARETVEFAEEVVSHGSRFLGIGSMIEDDPQVNSPYVVAKRQAAEGVLAAGGSASLSAWLRPSWIFDFLEPRPRVLREAAESALARVPFRPLQPQDCRDFIHVDDVASAIRCALNSHAQGRVDIRSGHLTSVAALLSAYDSWRVGSSEFFPYQLDGPDLTPRPERDSQELNRLEWDAYQTVRFLGSFWTNPGT